ncbi:MAG: NAD(P)(+) transhydrogenase (Re/Si-specific) subunit beta [Rhodothermales bacterium]
MTQTLTELAYLVAAILFIIGMKRLQSPTTARGGNQLAAVGMLIAVVATLFLHRILTPAEMLIGLVIGGIIGAVMARKVAMTGMPEMVAALNGFGGLASALVALAEVLRYIIGSSGGSVVVEAAQATPAMAAFDETLAITIALSVLIGMVTFSGSFVAFGKLGEYISGNPVSFPGMRVLSILLMLGTVVAAGIMVWGAAEYPATAEPVIWAIVLLSIFALALGVLIVIPIGGADMPVVVALLNSYSGLAAAATGFVLDNTALIVSGALVGASGLILSKIMCVAMNRSLANVLLGGFGGDSGAAGDGMGATAEGLSVNSTSAEDVAIMLAYAEKVIIVPGYGMAVAQAQHQVRELSDILSSRGVTVKFAIHPVAGRMPGHMNVLLAEANVPYDQLFEMDEINSEFETTDVSLVIGANDVVNPAARSDKSSPIYGMPILNVDRSRTTIVLKRSMRPGYAGIENMLFYNSNTQMLFGDAKKSLTELISAVKSA